MSSISQSPRTGYVYLIRMGDTSYHKVGISQFDISQRLAQLQTANPIELVLLAYHQQEDPLEVERAIHKVLRPFHARGEWFSLPTDDIMQVFTDYNTMALVDALIDDAPPIEIPIEIEPIYKTESGLSFNGDEVRTMAALIATGGGKTESVKAMPGYTGRRHAYFVALYEFAKASLEDAA